jgi:thioesterase domain-containing protein
MPRPLSFCSSAFSFHILISVWITELLGGWSMGGLVAWEMAQQLMKEGETISLLALIDTAPPPKYRETDDRADEISMLARFALDISRLVGMDPRPLAEQFSQAAAQDQWKMVQETLTNYGVLAPKTAHAEMTALLDVFTPELPCHE